MSTPRSTALAIFIAAGALPLIAMPIVAAGVVAGAAAQSGAPQKFSVTITNGKADIDSIRVTQGQQAEIMLVSDLSAELHMHGYDLLVHLEPGVPAPLSFAARIAGRFPVEAHRIGPVGNGRRPHGALFYVDIYPP
jgi:hypothetical protein